MRDLTIHELDAELAEQLPARELMGSCCHGGGTPPSGGPGGPPPGPAPAPTSTTTTTTTGSYDGNGNVGLVNLGNGSLDGNSVVIQG